MDSIEEEKGFFGMVDVSLRGPIPTEATTQSRVKACVSTAQESVEPRLRFKTERNDVIAGINEVCVEENSHVTDRENKRLKMSDLAHIFSVTDMQSIQEERIINSVDRPDFALPNSFCFNSVSEPKEFSKDGISGDAAESGSLDGSLLCCLENEKTASINDGSFVSQTSNEGRNESHSVQLRQVNLGENPDTNEVTDFVSNACAVDNSIFEGNASKKEAHNLKSEEENDSESVTISPIEETKKNTDPCLLQLDESTNVASQAVSDNVASTDGALSISTERKLLVLDINGLLVSICSYVPYDYDPDDIILRKAVFKRPYCDDFLRFCFEKFNVGVWTSKTKRNMEPIIDFLFGNDKHKLLFSWDQSHCTETGYGTVEKRQKPILLKKLKKLWDKYDPNLPWKKGEYNQTNTVLIDDTPHKALCNPEYTAVFPYTYHFRLMNDYSLGPGGDLRLYLEGLAMAENVQEYIKQNPFGQRPITERNLSWRYYLRVIEASTTPPRHMDEIDKSCNGDNPS